VRYLVCGGLVFVGRVWSGVIVTSRMGVVVVLGESSSVVDVPVRERVRLRSGVVDVLVEAVVAVVEAAGGAVRLDREAAV
jgi:hypothetical protein